MVAIIAAGAATTVGYAMGTATAAIALRYVAWGER